MLSNLAKEYWNTQITNWKKNVLEGTKLLILTPNLFLVFNVDKTKISTLRLCLIF